MQPLLPVQVTPELRAEVAAMVERLGEWGSPLAVSADGWSPFARALGLEEADASAVQPTGDDHVVVAVGPIDTAIERFERAAGIGVIGFVAPAAFRRRWWQREATVFLDPTLAVWDADWTPIAVSRIDVASSDATVEVVVGHARPTPARPTTASALDDAN